MKETAQIKRVRKNEEILDKASAALDELDVALENLRLLMPEIEALEKYYTGRMWKKDFSDDEKGLLPPDLKRGVLSEDAVYGILERLDAYKDLL